MGNHHTLSTSIRRNLAGLALAPVLALSAGAMAAEEGDEPPVLEIDGVTVVVKTDLEQTVQDVTVFKTDPMRSPVRLPVMQDVFGMHGAPTPAIAPVGAWMFTDAAGEHVLLVTPDGAAEYSMPAYDHASEPVDRVDDDMIWTKADALMEDLGAFDHPLIDVYALEISDEPCSGSFEECADPATAELGRQHAVYGHDVDGLPTFGAGATVSVRFAGTDEVVGMTHTLRGLRPDGRIMVIAPEDAVRSWMKACADGREWNLLEHEDYEPEVIEVNGITLGYLAPEFGTETQLITPVYEIRGVAFAEGANGELVSWDVMWHENVAGELGQ